MDHHQAALFVALEHARLLADLGRDATVVGGALRNASVLVQTNLPEETD